MRRSGRNVKVESGSLVNGGGGSFHNSTRHIARVLLLYCLLGGGVGEEKAGETTQWGAAGTLY